MSDEERIIDLLAEWEEQRARGNDPTPESLCTDDPKLREELRKRIQRRLSIGRLLDGPAVPSGAAAAVGSIPGFEILEKLGQGGVGVVYRARQAKLNRVVAIKMLLAANHASPSELRRFRQEAETIASLQHPHIVQIHEVGEHAGLPFLCLEFCPGGSLANKLNGTPLPPLEAAELVETLSLAMHEAHGKGLIHRDLKPGNILFGANGAPKVADFGLARKLDDSVRTASGAVVGTPSYMAPEQARGDADLGPACDIYALGAILYECLTGRPPFKAASTLDTLKQVIDQEAVSVSQLNVKVPRDLATICHQCLQKEPSRRYATAADLAADLGRLRRGEPIAARPVSRTERTWRWCRRQPALAAASFLAVAGTALALAMLGYALVATRNFADVQTKARETAERDALRTAFENYHAKAMAGDPTVGLLGALRLLPKAAKLKDELFVESLKLHAGAWLGEHSQLIEAREVNQESRVFGSNPNRYKSVFLSPTANRYIANRYTDEECEKSGPNDYGGIQIVDIATGRCRTFDPERPIPPFWRAVFQSDGERFAFATDEWLPETLFNGESRHTIDVRNAVTGDRIGATIQFEGGHPVIGFSKNKKQLITISSSFLCRWDIETGIQVGQSVKMQWYPISINDEGTIVLAASTMGRHCRFVFLDAETGKPIRDDLSAPGTWYDNNKRAILSPDGHRVFTWLDKLGICWHRPNDLNDLIVSLPSRVVAAAFDHTGSRLLTGLENQTTVYWDADNAFPLCAPIRLTGTMLTAAFAKDGKKIVTVSDIQMRAWIAKAKYDTYPRDLRSLVDNMRVNPELDRFLLELDPGGYGADLSSGIFWKYKVVDPDDFQSGKWRIAVDANRKRLVAVDRNGRAQFWNVETRKRIGESFQIGTKNPIGVLSFMPDGTMLLIDKQLWDVEKRCLIGELFETFEEKIRLVLFSTDGKKALAHGSKYVQLWDLSKRRPIGPLIRIHHDAESELSIAPSVALSGDGKSVAVSSGRTVRVWDAEKGTMIGSPIIHAALVTAVAIKGNDECDRVLFTACQDRSARFSEFSTGKQLGSSHHHWHDHIVRASFSRDGKGLFTIDYNSNIKSFPAPRPLSGDPDRLQLWAEVVTGAEMTDDAGNIRTLEAAEWRRRCDRLQELGGPPAE